MTDSRATIPIVIPSRIEHGTFWEESGVFPIEMLTREAQATPSTEALSRFGRLIVENVVRPVLSSTTLDELQQRVAQLALKYHAYATAARALVGERDVQQAHDDLATVVGDSVAELLGRVVEDDQANVVLDFALFTRENAFSLASHLRTPTEQDRQKDEVLAARFFLSAARGDLAVACLHSAAVGIPAPSHIIAGLLAIARLNYIEAFGAAQAAHALREPSSEGESFEFCAPDAELLAMADWD